MPKQDKPPRKSEPGGLRVPVTRFGKGSRSADNSPANKQPISRNVTNPVDPKIVLSQPSISDSTGKTYQPVNVTVHPHTQPRVPRPPEDTDSCPCGVRQKKNVWKIDCSKCKRYWHADCLSMSGIKKDSINSMLDYLCPFCYIPPARFINDDPDVCFTCKNTDNIRNLALWQETYGLTDCLSQFKTLKNEVSSINSDLTDNMADIREFDLHLKHLLFDKDKLVAYQNKVKSIEQLTASIDANVKELRSHDHRPHPEVELSSSSQIDLKKISDSLDELNAKVERLESRATIPTRIPPPVAATIEHPAPAPPRSTTHTEKAHNQKPFDKPVDDYLSQDLSTELLQFLTDDCQFTDTNGRSVCSFGAKYTYTGARAQHINEVPPLIQKVLDKVNNDFCQAKSPSDTSEHGRPATFVNQCLINKYSGQDAYLPEHADNEKSIDPRSSIFTISLGKPCDVRFRDLYSQEQHVISPKSGSLYSMSRCSQEFYTHRIEKTDMEEDVRYSITLRRVGENYKDSMCIVGDSNTRKLKFKWQKEDSQGTFGHNLPGERFPTYTVDQINPASYAHYQNIVVLCGVNSIKRFNVTEAEVEQVYYEFKDNLFQIRKFNPKANIFVCPLLPTKSYSINRKVAMFNSLIVKDLLESDLGVTWISGANDFVGITGYLSEKLSFVGDQLHLNYPGATILASMIKRAIYYRKGSGLVSGVSYGAVAGGPRRDPV